jgi:nitrite reductase/ring-hydroxylating ferredoxin subunit
LQAVDFCSRLIFFMLNKIKIPLDERKLPKEGCSNIIIHKEEEICIVCDSSKYYAFDNLCPHASASLGLGKIKNGEVVCPLHEYRFNYNTGKCNIKGFELKKYEVICEGKNWYILL